MVIWNDTLCDLKDSLTIHLRIQRLNYNCFFAIKSRFHIKTIGLLMHINLLFGSRPSHTLTRQLFSSGCGHSQFRGSKGIILWARRQLLILGLAYSAYRKIIAVKIVLVRFFVGKEQLSPDYSSLRVWFSFTSYHHSYINVGFGAVAEAVKLQTTKHQ